MRKIRKGGSYGPMPLKYFDDSLTGPDAAAGRDLLGASGLGIRPSIGCSKGGKRAYRKHTKKSKRNKRNGGFTPSIMGNFVQAASTYIVPLTLFSGYKLMTKHSRTTKKRRV